MLCRYPYLRRFIWAVGGVKSDRRVSVSQPQEPPLFSSSRHQHLELDHLHTHPNVRCRHPVTSLRSPGSPPSCGSFSRPPLICFIAIQLLHSLFQAPLPSSKTDRRTQLLNMVHDALPLTFACELKLTLSSALVDSPIEILTKQCRHKRVGYTGTNVGAGMTLSPC